MQKVKGCQKKYCLGSGGGGGERKQVGKKKKKPASHSKNKGRGVIATAGS